MQQETLNMNLQYITSILCDVVSNTENTTSQYELFLDLIYAIDLTNIPDSDYINYLRDALGQLNDKLTSKYDEGCKLFDTANTLECFQPKYSISKEPSFCDYAELLISILAMECLLVQNGTLDIKYSGHTIKRDFSSLIGRFLFLHNGYIKPYIEKDTSNYSDIFIRIFYHSVRVATSLEWHHEEYPQLRILILNLIDALTIHDKNEVKKIIDQAVSETHNGNLIISEDSLLVVYDTLNKYFDFIIKDSNIVEIKVSWLYSYIYKKRFGFIFCKKFAKSASASSLPYKFMAYSQAFKNATFIQVSNGPKVVLLNAGENKRSSEYVPTESSAFYNAASGMFE